MTLEIGYGWKESYKIEPSCRSKLLGMTSMKTIYLHIGMYKTGTSFIQKFCKNNYWQLTKHNVYYPVTGLHHDGAHFKFYQMVTSKSIDEKEIEELRKEISVCNCDNVLISIEHLVNNCGSFEFSELLKSIFKPHRIKIIIYFRRQDKYLESLYNQEAKLWFAGSIEDYYQKIIAAKQEVCAHQLNYRLIADKLSENFGKENIIIKTFEPQKKENWLLHSFFKPFGIDDFKDFSIPASENESLKCETISFLNKLSDDKTFGNDIYQHFGGWQSPPVSEFIYNVNLADKRIQGVKGFFSSPAFRKNICISYAEDNRYVAREYLESSNDLFLEPLPDEQEAWQEKELTLQTLVEITAFLNLRMIQKMNAIKEQIPNAQILAEKKSTNLVIDKVSVIKNKILEKIVIPFRLFFKYYLKG